MAAKHNKVTSIPGTRLSLTSPQLLTSTGISSLDILIGDGLPVGTLFLIQEDRTGIYAKTLLKYFMAEGVVNGHSLYIVSQDCDPESFIKNLPAVIEEEEPQHTLKNEMEDQLVIAWRYKDLGAKNPTTIRNFCNNFDLTKVMKQSMIDRCNVSYWSPKDKYEEGFNFKNPAYADVLRSISKTIEEKGFLLTANPPKGNILRIVVHLAGSPLWLPSNSNDSNDLNIFIYYLRSIARSGFVNIAVTVPVYLLNKETISNITHSSDVAVQLDSFVGTELEKNPALSDYHGFFKFKKFHTLSCLQNSDPGPTDFAFKLRRKKFVIDMLHLPPDLQESEGPNMTGCGGGGSSKLDF